MRGGGNRNRTEKTPELFGGINQPSRDDEPNKNNNKKKSRADVI
jgi:hypothetical protein